MVAFASERAFPAQRPILPPLHSLGLPNPPLQPGMTHAFHEHIYDNTLCPRLHIPQRQPHQASVSSPSSSRSSSPTLFDMSSTSSRASTPSTEPDTSASASASASSSILTSASPYTAPTSTPILSISPLPARAPPHPTAPPMRFRLEPCTLAEAQAIVLIPPPSAPFIPSSSMPRPPQKQQALLLLGHSLEYFRQPNRQLAKGARVHPYRITQSRRRDGDGRMPDIAGSRDSVAL